MRVLRRLRGAAWRIGAGILAGATEAVVHSFASDG
jgi:hypothetical protein